MAHICELNPICLHARNRRRGVTFLTLAGSLLTLLLGGCGGNAGMTAYRNGDYNEALREFKSEGDPEGDFALGVMHYKGEGVAHDPDEAVAWFRRAAENGHAGAQYNLGLLYLRGEGVQKDRREAAHWFCLAAKQGFARAQINLGLLYARGDGVEKDPDEAAVWLRKAADQGSYRAKEYLKRLNVSGSAGL